MLNRRTLTAMAVAVGVTLSAVHAQQRRSPAGTLTAQDYFEIQQLVAKYSYALDTGANNGYAYADLFTADGTFGKTTGREELAASARPGGGHYPRGPNFVFHYTSNHVIETTAEGAVGKVYVVEIDAGERGKTASVIEDGGHYEDVYRKTPQGWRFQSRSFIKTQPGTPPTQPR